MDSEAKTVDMDRINSLTLDLAGWNSKLSDLDSKYVNLHINQKCNEGTWIPNTSKINDIGKGASPDWK